MIQPHYGVITMKIPFTATSPSNLSRLAATIALILSPFHLEAADAPNIMTAQNISTTLFSATEPAQDNISDYYVSEKLDGIRAFWTGQQLVTRSGKAISVPAWFTASLPENTLLDGELWAGRNSFQQVAATILDHTPNDKQWQKIKFMIFDLPSSSERFDLRLKQLTTIVTTIGHSHIQVIPQYSFESSTALESKLDQTTQDSGEGLMLHHKDNLYHHGRSNQLLKMKQHQDAEAIVIGYEAGKGKYNGKMGAIWVLTADNIKFKIGSGFSDADRETPPALGSIVNFRHNGYINSGIPRFARFIRSRPSSDM